MAEAMMVEDDCVFCRIVAGYEPATVLRGWSTAIAITPLHPVTVGHVLVIPRRHVRDFTERPMVTSQLMHHAASYAAQVGGPFNLITSAGRAATQTVMHLHVHLVPRHSGDGLKLPWSEEEG